MFVLYIGSLFTEPVIFLNEILPGPVREKRGRLLPFFVAAYLGDTRDTRNTARSKLEPPQHPQNCRPFTGCRRVGKWLLRRNRRGLFVSPLIWDLTLRNICVLPRWKFVGSNIGGNRERYSKENAAFKIVGRDKEREERRGRGGQGRNNEYRSKGISTRYKRVLFPRLL